MYCTYLIAKQNPLDLDLNGLDWAGPNLGLQPGTLCCLDKELRCIIIFVSRGGCGGIKGCQSGARLSGDVAPAAVAADGGAGHKEKEENEGNARHFT